MPLKQITLVCAVTFCALATRSFAQIGDEITPAAGRDGGWIDSVWTTPAYEFLGVFDYPEKEVDVNQDGFADRVFTARFLSGGTLGVLDGRTGEIQVRWEYIQSGTAVPGFHDAEDITGDGTLDLLLFRAEPDGLGTFRSNLIWLDGRTGLVLSEIQGPDDAIFWAYDVSLLRRTGQPPIAVLRYEGTETAYLANSSTQLWQRSIKTTVTRERRPLVQDLDGDGSDEYYLMYIEPFLSGSFDLKKIDPTTGLVEWTQQLNRASDDAELLRFSDVNRDGHDDLVIYRPQVRLHDESDKLNAFDGKTGSRLWAYATADGNTPLELQFLQSDFTGDQVDDFVFLGSQNTAAHQGRCVAIDGATGAELWHLDAHRILDAWSSDFDLDGELDIALHVNESAGVSYVSAFDLRDGSPIWSPAQILQDAGILLTGDLNGDGALDFVASNIPLGGSLLGLAAYSGATGHEMWRVGQRPLADSPYPNATIELTGDDSLDVIASDSTGVFVLDGRSGLVRAAHDEVEYLMSREAAGAVTTGQFFTRRFTSAQALQHDTIEMWTGTQSQSNWQIPIDEDTVWSPRNLSAGDLDGDGAFDILHTRKLLAAPFVQDVYEALPGGRDPFRRGLSLSTNRISVASGGQITAQIDMHPDFANTIYALWYSASGPGAIVSGRASAPLNFDTYTSDSMNGIYPYAWIDQPRGFLDANGQATVQFDFPPNGIPAALVGTDFGMCFVNLDPALPFGIRLSTVRATLEIEP